MPPQTDGHQRIPQVSSACRMRIRAVAGQRAAAVARGRPLPSHLRQRSARRIKAPVTCRARTQVRTAKQGMGSYKRITGNVHWALGGRNSYF